MRHNINFGDPRFPPWFWLRAVPEPNTGCWIWIGALDADGYGHYGRNPAGVGGSPLVHRTALGVLEPLIDGLTVDHRCELTCCVNPAHLEQVTAAENTHRRQLRNRVCHRGHVLDAANTLEKHRITDAGNPRIERACRTCHADRQRDYRAGVQS